MSALDSMTDVRLKQLQDERAELLAVLREFAQDVAVVGESTVRQEWPDLTDTYRRARAAIAKAEGRDL